MPVDGNDVTKPSIFKTRTVDLLCFPCERIAPEAASIRIAFICWLYEVVRVPESLILRRQWLYAQDPNHHVRQMVTSETHATEEGAHWTLAMK